MGKKDKEKLYGETGFEGFYSQVYGERWPLLKESLYKPTVYFKLSFGQSEDYFLDPGSICAALSLKVKGSKRLLDLCAAPGGKTLCVSSVMDEDAVLYSNERSGERKARLVKVVSSVLPDSIKERVVTSCSDGATWCRRESEAYDSILLDAPCSSERHVLLDPKYLKDWSPSRIKTLSMEQWALLSSAWRLLKKDGCMVYATCALSPQENDAVIEKLLKKFDDVEVQDFAFVSSVFAENLKDTKASFTSESGIRLEEVFSKAEHTQFGFHILPDAALGAGPLFFCLLHKKS